MEKEKSPVTPIESRCDDRIEILSSIKKLMKGHRPIVYLHTYEEARTMELLTKAYRDCFGSDISLYTWSLTRGLMGVENPGKLKDPVQLIDFIRGVKSPGVFFLSDFHRLLKQDSVLIRKMRDLYYDLLDSELFVFLCSGVKEIPAELENEIAYVEIELPGIEELKEFLQKEPSFHARLLTSEKDLSIIGRTLQGLTFNEARHALLSAMSSSPEPGALVSELQKEKKLQARKTGLVEYIPEVTPFNHIGGLKNLKEWLIKRKSLVHIDGAYDSEIIPKGILLMGMSGCGKSLSIKAIASLWELPLYRLDMVRVYSGMHGKPEEAFIRACETMEKVSPAILWIDEIEMGINIGETHEGASSRIFGYFLTWMQEKKEGLFLAATANRIEFLPAEILRRGRFDQIFFIDLPTPDERFEIFKIHLLKRGFNHENFDLNLLADLTDGCNGAEIEQCVISAVVEAKIAGREPTQKDLISAKRLIVPLSKTMQEQIRRIKQWAFNRATPAT